MFIKFDVFFERDLGVIYKDNSIIVHGKEAKVDLDLDNVHNISAVFNVNGKSYTDLVEIVDIENKLVRIPFKTDVIKKGSHKLELKAIMKDGEALPSQTYIYTIAESLENPNSVEAETNYPILIKLLQDVGDKMDDMNKAIAKVDDSVEEMKASIDEYKDLTSEDLNNRFNEYKENADSVLDSKFENYSNAVTENINKVLDSKSNQIDSKINEVDKALDNTVKAINDTLEAKVVEVDKRIDNKLNEVNELIERVEVSEEEREERHNAKIEELNGYANDVNAIKQNVSTNTKDIEDLKSGIKDFNNADIERLNSIVNNHEVRIKANENSIKTHDILINSLFEEELKPTITLENQEGNVISLPQSTNGIIEIQELQGNTMVNYCQDGGKELTLNSEIDVEGADITLSDTVDGGLVDVVCEGNTLVNVLGDGFSNPSIYKNNEPWTDYSLEFDNEWLTVYSIGQWSGIYRGATTMPLLKPSTKYTLIVEVKENTLSIPYQILHASNNIFIEYNSSVEAGFAGIKKFLFTTQSDLSDKKLIQVMSGQLSTNTTDKITYRQILLEGDWTDKEIPPYFEGMKSVGQDDENGHKVEIVGQSKNLFNGKLELGWLNNGSVVSSSNYIHTPNYIKVNPDKPIVVWFENIDEFINISEYDKNKEHIKTTVASGTPLKLQDNCCFVRIGCRVRDINLNLQIEYDVKTSYVPYATNARSIQLSEPLRGLPNGVKDRFVKIGGKPYVKRQCYERDYIEGDEHLSNAVTDTVKTICELESPIYELLDTDLDLATYLDTTHISTNSTIPCNMKISNTGYNAVIKPSTQYTVAFDTDKAGEVGISLGGARATTTNSVATITTPATLLNDELKLYGKGIKSSKVRLLEGDKTNYIPSYFEGMQSCFEDKLQDDGTYKMEILSNNKNLLNISEVFNKDNLINGIYNSFPICGLKPNTVYSFQKYNNIEQGKGFSINIGTEPNTTSGAFIYHNNGGNVNFKSFKSTSDGKLYFNTNIGTGYSVLTLDDLDKALEVLGDMQLHEGSVSIDYVPHKSDKIQLSSIEPLRGFNNIKDKFVFENGKILIKRNLFEGEYREGDEHLSDVLTDGVRTIRKLDVPTYEEVPYELSKLILECYEDGTLSFNTNIPPTSTITYTANIPVARKINNLDIMNTNLVSTTWDMDYRLFELEWTIYECMATTINLEEIFNIRRNNVMALSRFEQAKIMILGGVYDDTTLRKQLSMYLSRGIVKQDEYDELISMMDARLLVEGN